MVKMVLGSSDTQASSVATLASNYSTAFNNIISAVDTLGKSDKLSGSAYKNIKSYTNSVVTPLAQGMILLADAAKADTKLLPDRYRSDVGEDELSDDTEVLSAEIEALNATINTNNSLLEGMESDDPNKSMTENAVKNDTAERDKRQKKLDKINAYDAASSGFFSDIAGLEANISSGLSLLQSGVAGFNGTFQLPSKGQLKWADSINKDFKQYQDYQSAVAKAAKGEDLSEQEAKAIATFQEKHPNRNVDDEIAEQQAPAVLRTLQQMYDVGKIFSDNDILKYLKTIKGATPKALAKALIASPGFMALKDYKDGKLFWAISKGVRKYSQAVKGAGEWIKNSNWASQVAKATKPLITGAGKYIKGAEKVGKLIKPIKPLAKYGLKALGKGATVLTYLEVGYAGASGAVKEYQKSHDVGRAAIKGTFSAVKSVGPLEGATIGASIGSVIPGAGTGVGAAVGLAVGTVLWGLNKTGVTDWLEKGAMRGYEKAKATVKSGVKAAGKAVNNVKNTVSNAVGGLGKAFGFG
ncbi:hypothetical protein ACVR1G_07445 [Streptococcus dentasini]